ncbi:MAG: hypothetical protein M3280_06470 [Actinomycetota bacterium]|nr:hypothetical protein [Actinomycetota bacterium]
MTEDLERKLDRALGGGKDADDPRITSLLQQADEVQESLRRGPPSEPRERSLFIQALTRRRSRFAPLKALAPVAVVVAGLLAIAGFGRTALPGDALYAVREALASVGLAKTPVEEADRRIDDAEETLEDAELIILRSPGEARSMTLDAIVDLGRAKRLLGDVNADQREALLARVEQAQERAVRLLVDVSEVLKARRGAASPTPAPSPSASQEDEDDDNSGPGGDDGHDDDNSGPGSDDDDSGPGGDDDSGPGSDGDSSGPGSDGDGGDNSGPGGGGGGSGSGGGDSSGSGSGSDD